MKIAKKYNGKWIATKKGEVIASADTYDAVKAKVKRNDNEKVYFGLVPSTPHFIGA